MKPVIISISPNLTRSNVKIAAKYIFNPWRFVFGLKAGIYQEKFKSALQDYLNVKDLYLLNSGRSALYQALKIAGVGEGDEVILQAFTCMVVPNVIKWTGAKPIYVDIDKNTYNIDPKLLEQQISSKTKAIIIQHTYGIPAELSVIKDICARHKIYLIEDCAHALGVDWENKKIGTHGDLAILTFGRDKTISTVSGGALIINNAVLKVSAQEIMGEVTQYPSTWNILQNLLNTLFGLWIKRFYFTLNFGKLVIVVLQKLRLLNTAYEPQEFVAKKPSFTPTLLPNCLAETGCEQLEMLPKFISQRQTIARAYSRALQERYLVPAVDSGIFLRYPVLVANQQKVLRAAQKQKIILGNWYQNLIMPLKDDQLAHIDYKLGSCSVAEKLTKYIVNLPTYYSLEPQDVIRVINLIKTVGQPINRDEI